MAVGDFDEARTDFNAVGDTTKHTHLMYLFMRNKDKMMLDASGIR